MKSMCAISVSRFKVPAWFAGSGSLDFFGTYLASSTKIVETFQHCIFVSETKKHPLMIVD